MWMDYRAVLQDFLYLKKKKLYLGEMVHSDMIRLVYKSGKYGLLYINILLKLTPMVILGIF